MVRWSDHVSGKAFAAFHHIARTYDRISSPTSARPIESLVHDHDERTRTIPSTSNSTIKRELASIPDISEQKQHNTFNYAYFY
eukprot:scaffold5259_cov120-Cylindrotheca_fusiformis.AAC.3